MPRRTDIESVLVIGSGPIVIGQACEFDYSGTQACRVLREEGFRVVLVNSNPATIMTDPEFADATYVEPLDVEAIHTAEYRSRFKDAMSEIGLTTPGSGLAYSVEEALTVGEVVGFPLICRPSFILGGGGTGFAHSPDELREVATRG